MENSLSKKEITTIKVKMEMDVRKDDVNTDWAESWIEDTLYGQAAREGWLNLLTIEIISIDSRTR